MFQKLVARTNSSQENQNKVDVLRLRSSFSPIQIHRLGLRETSVIKILFAKHMKLAWVLFFLMFVLAAIGAFLVSLSIQNFVQKIL